MKIARITNDGKLLIKDEVIENEGETYDFDGTNRVDIKPFVSPENNMFNNESFVFECEVNHTNASGFRTIYSDTANDQFSYNRIGIQNSKLVIQFINQGTNELTLTSTETVTANEWVKIKVVRNGFEFTIYINGIEDVTGTWNKGNWSYAPVPSNNIVNCSLGVTYYDWNFMNPFIGKMRNINLIPTEPIKLTTEGDLHIKELVEQSNDFRITSSGILYLNELVEDVDFSPILITPDLYIHFSNDSISGDIGDSISAWVDDLNNKSAIQNTVTSQPIVGELNGLKTVYFEGNKGLVFDDTELINGATVFMVAYPIGTETMNVISHTNINAQMRFSGNSFQITGSQNLGIPNVSIVRNSWSVISARITNSTAQVSANSVRGAVKTHSNSSFRINQLGRRGSWNEPFTGHIGEIVIYNRALDEEEIVSIEQYLMEKWGV